MTTGPWHNCDSVKNVWSRNRVTQSGAELLQSRRELTTKMGNNLGLSSYAVPQSSIAYGCVFQED